jgi:internalin A
MRQHFGQALAISLGAVLWLGALARAAEIKGGAADTKWIDDLGGVVIKDAAGHVTGIDLRSTWVSDTDLRKLTRYPYLSTLDLSLTRITDTGIQELKPLTGIVEFNLYYAEYVTDEGTAAIKGWKNLKRLNVNGTKITDTTLEHIGGITSIESLNIGRAMVTTIGLERLTGLPNLKELTIGGNKIDDAGLQALRQMPSITYLDLGGRQGTDANIWAVKMTDPGFNAVLSLKNLQDLRFQCTSVGAGVEGQKFADIRYVSVTQEWLVKMKALPKLERLQLQSCDRLNDAAVQALASVPSLKEVDLKGTAITEAGVAALKAAKPGLKVVYGPWVAQAAAFRNN